MIKDVTPDMVPEVPTNHPLKDSLRAGIFFLLETDTKTLFMLLGLFVTNYVIWGNAVRLHALLFLVLSDGEFARTLLQFILSLMTGLSFLPLIVFTMRRAILNEIEASYFSYFLLSPLWRLYLIRWVFILFIVAPMILLAIVLILSFDTGFTTLEPLSGPYNYFVLLPVALFLVCAVFARFLLVFVHVPIKNRLELWPVFFLSKGHGFTIALSTFISVVPLLLFIFVSSYFLAPSQGGIIAEIESGHALTWSLLITAVGALSFLPSATLAHLYKIIVTLRKEILRKENIPFTEKAK